MSNYEKICRIDKALKKLEYDANTAFSAYLLYDSLEWLDILTRTRERIATLREVKEEILELEEV